MDSNIPIPPTQNNSSQSFHWWEVEGDASDRIAALMQRLEIVSKRKVEAMFSGAYRSVFQGRGMDFSEVRPYQPGDEIRWIDWNVSARMDDIYVKQFVEERERTVMLVWDASPSMLLGSHWRSKQELGAEVCMLLAMSALANNDRVGLVMFSDGVERYIQPQRGRTHLMRIVREILSFESPEPTAVSRIEEDFISSETGSKPHRDNVFDFLNRVAPRHSIVFFLSDFLSLHETARWQRLSQRCEVIPMLLRDPLETSVTLKKSDKVPMLQHPFTWAIMSLVFFLGGWGMTVGGATLYSAVFVTILVVAVMLLYGRSQKGTMLVDIVSLERTNRSETISLGRWNDNSQSTLPVPFSPSDIRKSFQRLRLDLIELQTNAEPADELRAFFRRRQGGAS